MTGRATARAKGRLTGLRAAAAALVALSALLAGCSPGSEPIRRNSGGSTPGATSPAATPDEAAGILRDYLSAMRTPDAAAIKSVEASTARSVHTALLRLGPVTPDVAGEFAIPRFTGYPRWFAAGAVGPGMTGDVAIFVRTREDSPWRVHRVVRLTRPMPELSRDAEGYVSVAEPGGTAARQARALTAESDDAVTTPLAEALRKNAKLFSGANWTVSQKTGPYGRAYALRAKDGGTVVWYVLTYTFTATNTGGRFEITLADEAARLLRDPVVSRALSWQALYQSAAHVPASGAEQVLGISLPGWVRMSGG